MHHTLRVSPHPHDVVCLQASQLTESPRTGLHLARAPVAAMRTIAAFRGDKSLGGSTAGERLPAVREGEEGAKASTPLESLTQRMFRPASQCGSTK